MKKIFTRALCFLLLFYASTIFSIPAPMSESMLLDKSDLVGTFRVLAVTRTADIQRYGQSLKHYQAWMQVINIKKGELKPYDTFLVEWNSLPQKMVGPWAVAYFPGQIVETHLVKNNNVYTTTAWNASNVVKSINSKLPEKIGAMVYQPD